MQATNFLNLRGGYVHHPSSSLHPSVTSYSLLRRHNYLALTSASTVPASCFTSNPGSPGIPRNDCMKNVLKWVTLAPLDEEYREELEKSLFPIFSEYGLIRHRFIIQDKWNEWLLKQSDIPESEYAEISKVLQKYQKECNSEVIELAFGMMLKRAIKSVIVPRMTDICEALISMVDDNHVSGQPPLTLGRQLALVANKLREQARCVSKIIILGQLSGGENYIGDRYSEMDWHRINKELVTSLGLEFDSNVDSENHIKKLILEMVNFNKIVVDFFNEELQSYIFSGCFKLEGEGESIEFERKKINLLSPPNMIKTLDIRRPHSKRDMTGIVEDVPQDLVGLLGYSLVGYEGMLKVLRKLQ